MRLLAGLLCCAPAVAALKCAADYSPCFAAGTDRNAVPPSVGPDMAGLYTDLVASVEGHSLERRDDSDKGSLCCRSSMKCLLLRNRKLSFCWDRFTNYYYLLDGSYGSITTGIYNAPSRDTVDLIRGNFTRADGATGDIYAAAPQDRPNLSSLRLPKPFTAKGEGTAIPGSELGAPPGAITASASGASPTTPGAERTVTATVTNPAASASKTGGAVALVNPSAALTLLMGSLLAVLAV
ncbi:hypothetical protein LOZ52_004474 [Ophidiomyces ophidiicola]|nr:hypothetical protein LOZ64_000812 [Ophidiomyces ophidiicola]KAI2010649.1 hypothetical protein LOZ49_003386 [Ophidiomyces ophidiicola]KAI2016013.1 hypothetical protein LOZ46_005113 [Ophidiomyces ophidiicola]KAI2135101.1 hypothetical protein LOZ29_003991 [Ophidiomyces ophidiicola]KAI2137301.1 hypothetical protein LOZ28_003910 [Ophidiomyces ophidiicola]